MLKKRKHKIKRRNTEPSVNHPLVLATPSAGPGAAAPGGGGGTAAAAQEKLRRHNEQLQKQQMQSGTITEFMDMEFMDGGRWRVIRQVHLKATSHRCRVEKLSSFLLR